jgi:hypothetical protein
MKNAFLILVILSALFTIIGCASGEDYDPPSDKGECPVSYWGDNWGYPEFISFFDDSLAIYKTIRYKTEYYKEYFLFEGEKCVPFATERHFGLWLANYRFKQKPILIDTLDYDLKIVSGCLKDSFLLVIKDNEFGFWKIGRNLEVGLNSIIFKEISGTFIGSLDRANSWIDGNILLTYSSQKLVLNTKTGKVEYLDIPEQDEWLNSCKDISYINDKIVCIRFNYADVHWELVVDGVVLDTKKLTNGVLLNDRQIYYSSLAFSEKNKWLSRCHKILHIDEELICRFEDESIDDIIVFYNSTDDMERLWKELFHAIMNFDGRNYAIIDPGNFGEVNSRELIKIDPEKFKFDDTFKSILVNYTIKYSEEDFK